MIAQQELQLIGSQCQACAAPYYPALRVCPACHSTALTSYALPLEGSLYSYSIVRIGPRQFAAPYAVGYVDLPDGLRIFARIQGWESGLHCDLPVRLQVIHNEDGEPLCTAHPAAATAPDRDVTANAEES